MSIIQLISSLVFTTLIAIFILPTQGAIQQGFTTKLIYRDSPLSPLYDPSISKWDRVRNSFQQSISRLNYISRSLGTSNDIQAPLSGAGGGYVMELSVGTPPVKQHAIADTGSDLIWFQCQPCVSCYEQQLAIFDSGKSSSYKVQSCESKGCQSLSRQSSCSAKGTCEYRYAYGDRSQTTGDLASETLTFKSSGSSNVASFPKVTFGCGHNNHGTFSEKESGLVGLGRGPLSFVSQLSSSIGGTFSHCLIPLFGEESTQNLTSKINFGTNGVVSGSGVVSTPLSKGSEETFYYLTLEGISVRKVRLPFTNYKRSNSLRDANEKGNIIIDSGTTLTFLPDGLYNELSKSLVKVIKGEQLKDPTGTLELCYQATEDLNLPTLTVHFAEADIKLKPINAFIKVSDDVICLAMLSSEDLGIAIYGNIAQVNFLVGYDIEEGKVSFKPIDCTKGQ